MLQFKLIYLKFTGSQSGGEAANGDGGGEHAAVQVAVGGSGNIPRPNVGRGRSCAGKVEAAEGPDRYIDEPGIFVATLL